MHFVETDHNVKHQQQKLRSTIKKKSMRRNKQIKNL